MRLRASLRMGNAIGIVPAAEVSRRGILVGKTPTPLFFKSVLRVHTIMWGSDWRQDARGWAASFFSTTWLARALKNFCALALGIAVTAQGGETSLSNSAPDIVYSNYRKPSGPWSIHVVRVPRGKSLFQVQAVHAGGRA